MESESFHDMEELSNHMGLFLQKTNIIRDYLVRLPTCCLLPAQCCCCCALHVGMMSSGGDYTARKDDLSSCAASLRGRRGSLIKTAAEAAVMSPRDPPSPPGYRHPTAPQTCSQGLMAHCCHLHALQ